jgi:hypothetical protein
MQARQRYNQGAGIN